ncbi:hypothetical protein [Halorussus marinus]|uniref:hypothetical protein n=1 Tax=Halorussus marinus TaxID=2505976 RepID=UPI00106E1EE5|nr:hypothetical protein [Halorussus marinus]
MASRLRGATGLAVGRVLSGLAVLSAGVAVAILAFPNPLADVFFTGIVALGVVFALVGAFGAWTNRTAFAWAGALLLAGLSVAGLMSIGFVLAPAAVFLLGAALCSQLAGPRIDVREAIVADPPTVSEIGLKALIGTVSVAAGAGAGYAGAVRRDLFGACATETLECALAKANWAGIGTTLLGVVAISLGAWLVWRQIYVSRVLASA